MKDLFGETEDDLEIMAEIEARIAAAQKRYGAFASTHEALGVACEEWDELRESSGTTPSINWTTKATLTASILRTNFSLLPTACQESLTSLRL